MKKLPKKCSHLWMPNEWHVAYFDDDNEYKQSTNHTLESVRCSKCLEVKEL